jgi:hypothetical protein
MRIDPSDTCDFSTTVNYFRVVGRGGTVKLKLADGTVTTVTVRLGDEVYLPVRRIYSTGTTARDFNNSLLGGVPALVRDSPVAFGGPCAAAGGGGGGSGVFGLVAGFAFSQVDNQDFQYAWTPGFGPDRVVYLEFSPDGETWHFFTWEATGDSSPLTQTGWATDGWPEAGHDFVAGHTYYLRARYQDVYPDPAVTDEFTVLSFVAE